MSTLEWDSNYRRLNEGDIIQIGDEFDGCRDGWRDDAIWKPVTSNHPRLYQPAPNPDYPAHTVYRRKIK